MLIEVYSDIACPWCYIGERRLERALAERPEIKAECHWRAFQLQPDLPAEGMPWRDLLDAKFGGAARAETIFARVAAAGAPDGIDFRFDRMVNAPNTRDAHRLIAYAAAQDKEWPMATALFAAHFTEGRDVGDRDELVAIAASAGVDPDAARAFLASDEGVAEVAESQTLAYRRGVQGVPLYVFNGKYALSGAQPLEVFHEVFDAVLANYS